MGHKFVSVFFFFKDVAWRRCPRAIFNSCYDFQNTSGAGSERRLKLCILEIFIINLHKARFDSPAILPLIHRCSKIKATFNRVRHNSSLELQSGFLKNKKDFSRGKPNLFQLNSYLGKPANIVVLKKGFTMFPSDFDITTTRHEYFHFCEFEIWQLWIIPSSFNLSSYIILLDVVSF